MSAGHSPNVRLTVFKRDDWTCRSCGFRQTEADRRRVVGRRRPGRFLTIDHIVPRSKGGRNAAENLQVLCNVCNREKADSLDPADAIPGRVKKARRYLQDLRKPPGRFVHSKDCTPGNCVASCEVGWR
jgi:5-methylcytosine-specific restriction enzyme A